MGSYKLFRIEIARSAMESFIAVFSFSNVLRRLAELHVAVFFLAIKGPRRYIVLLADGLG